MDDVRRQTEFHRPPRAHPPPVPEDEVVVLAPPQKTPGGKQPLMYALFPVVGSMGIFAFALIYDNKVFLYVACAMVALTLLFAVGIRWAQKRSGKKDARRQRRLYREYLEETDEKLGEIAAVQGSAGAALYPLPDRLWSAALKRRRLWERRDTDDDFLTLRVGEGPVEHAARPRLDLGHNPLAEYEQKLVDEATELVERWRVMPGLPVTVSLDGVVSLVGPAARTRAAARAMVAQLAIGRAPTELRIAASYDAGPAEEWEWLKWLPHTRDQLDSEELAPPPVAMASTPGELAALLEERVTPRISQLGKLSALTGGEHELQAPHLVLIVDGFSPTDDRARLPLMREVLRGAQHLRMSVICLVESADEEPSETAVRVRVPERGAASVEETRRGGHTTDSVLLDEVPVGAGEAMARTLAPIRLADDEDGTTRSDGGFLDLHGLPSIGAVDPKADWADRPRELELRATVGRAADGEPLVLDLKQQAEGGMGPHGLIIGATGSGKSELLRTLVASLAMTHSPERLAFVFVDYKGGQALAELESLPHTAGMITNLQGDLRMVDRMHDALYGEQKRREQILRDAGNVDDVVAYRKLRESKPDLPPLPDLLVIIDEFSELLAAQPEFIDLFVAIGRVGRSLGIHLLFTSQRFEEGRLRGLESNLRYRICLRTYSPAESKGVIGTPDAYTLPSDPGFGYLKVDADLYQRFRGSLVTRTHREPVDPAVKKPRIARFVPSLRRLATGEQRAGDGDGPTEMKLLVERLAKATRDRRVHQVWLPPLHDQQPLDSLPLGPAFWDGEPGRPLETTVGMIDLPREQRVVPLSLDLSGAAGHMAVVGAPQSGKSSLLRTLALSLARGHTPEQVQLYGVDLGGGLLDALRELPHVGAVAGKGDRELVRLIIGRAKAEIEAREAAFRRLGIDSMTTARAQQGGEESFADVFLLIDGWAQLRRDFEDLDFEVEEIASAGLTYGVHVVITAQRWGEMRPSVSDNLGTRLELRLNDPLESAFGRRQAERLPADVPGRGLLGDALEFQAALPRLDGEASADGLGEATGRAAKEIGSKWKGEPAPPVRLMPSRVPAGDLPQAGSGSELVLGVDEALDPASVDLSGADPHFLVLGDGESGRTNLLRAIAHGLVQANSPEEARLIVVDPRRTLNDLAELPHTAAYATSQPAIADAAQKLASLVEGRLPDSPGAANGANGKGSDHGGAEVYLLVDDYDLFAGPEGNPLAPLATALAQGRDAGFHVILARRVAGSTRAAFEPFYSRLMELRTPGILLSGDRAEGPILDGQRAEARPPGRGMLVRRGAQPAIVQAALASPGDAFTGAASGRTSGR